MCQVPSWIVTKDAVLFLTDKDAEAHGIDWKDATGHAAIRKVWKGCGGTEGEGLGKDTPQVVVDAFLSGRMNRLIAAGDLLIRNGEWTMPALTTAGNVSVYGKFDAPALTTAGNVSVYVYGKFDVPALTTAGNVSVYGKFDAPALTTAGDVSVYGKFDAPALTTAGDVSVYVSGKFDAPKLGYPAPPKEGK